MHPVGDLHRADVGEGDANVLGLAAVVAAEEVRVPEEGARAVADRGLLEPGVGVAVVAGAGDVLLAEPAPAAGDAEGDDDAVADLEVVDVGAELDDLAHELVPEDVVLLHRRDVAVVQVQVAPADGGARHAQDRVAAVEDLGIGHVFDAHILLAHPADGLHG